MSRTLHTVVAMMLLLATAAVAANAVSRGVARAAARRLSRSEMLKQDSLRHNAPVKPLAQPRTVHRYTTMTQARKELREGIAPGRHMTATAKAGRPMSARRAQQYYGLPRKPTARETVKLDRGFPVRHNPATGAAPGVGELTSPQRVPAENVVKVIPTR